MTHTSRRAVLRAGAAAAFLSPVAWALPAEAASGSTQLYRRSRFAPLVNKSFKLAGKTGPWRVTLTEVASLPGATAEEQGRFSLTFTAAGTGPTQGTYLLCRRGFHDTSLFVVPSDGQRRTYEAIVNNI